MTAATTAGAAAAPVDRRHLDTRLPLAERVRCLVSQMTLREKIAQMLHQAPPIPRLGVPRYVWWNECLHGVGRAGKATVFPQAIGLAATFDVPLLRRVAAAIGDEARAKHHDAVRRGNREMYFGLTFWSPNINLFRDPRWGRGQETYGEDPYLAARLGVAFVRGLQGDDPRHLKAAACAKHYAVHSGPEPERHRFDARCSARDLHESYLPHFEACVREGGVEAVMGAYTRVNGEACCASPTLLGAILRGAWGFGGHVVSDCGAIEDICHHHKLAGSMAAAAAMAVRAGCDLCCGEAYRSLLEAVQQGLLTEAEIDRAVTRLFRTRFRLGLFDPDDKVRWARIPPAVVHGPKHRRLALAAARKSIVLLKNEGGLLPLDPARLRTIAVVGPNAYATDVLQGNYFGHAPSLTTIMEGIADAVPVGVQVHCFKGCETTGGAAPNAEAIRQWHLGQHGIDLVVAVLGWSPALEGEEGDAGDGDRRQIGLPGHQPELLKILQASGLPVVLVLTGGSPIELEWAAANIPAIVMAWYPGEAGGRAVADVLFGRVNPSGRLPVTFVKSLDQVPPFADYAMRGRTYRVMTDEPRWHFGHGLSYTTFAYANLRLSRPSLGAGGRVRVKADVTNTGARAGEEVVQLYVSDLAASVPVPRLHLEGFKRVALRPGETRTVGFTLRAEQLVCRDDNGQPFLEPGEMRVSVGGGQPDAPASGAVSTTLLVR